MIDYQQRSEVVILLPHEAMDLAGSRYTSIHDTIHDRVARSRKIDYRSQAAALLWEAAGPGGGLGCRGDPSLLVPVRKWLERIVVGYTESAAAAAAAAPGCAQALVPTDKNAPLN
jgi:hypothetical protein